MAAHLDACYIPIVLVCLWCCSHCSHEPFRVVNMKQTTDKSGLVFASFVLQSGGAKSLLECAKNCLGQNGSRSLTFWGNSSTPSDACICYAVQSSDLSNQSPALAARCYSLEGITGERV